MMRKDFIITLFVTLFIFNRALNAMVISSDPHWKDGTRLYIGMPSRVLVQEIRGQSLKKMDEWPYSFKTMVYIGKPHGRYPNPFIKSYREFQASLIRPSVVYGITEDGKLLGVSADSGSLRGKKNLNEFKGMDWSGELVSHDMWIDKTWKTILFAIKTGEECEIHALDVTEPNTWQELFHLKKGIFKTEDGQPIFNLRYATLIFGMNDHWYYGLIGDSSIDSYLIGIDIELGKVGFQIKVGTNICALNAIDTQTAGKVDSVIFGDGLGKLWRVDLTLVEEPFVHLIGNVNTALDCSHSLTRSWVVRGLNGGIKIFWRGYEWFSEDSFVYDNRPLFEGPVSSLSSFYVHPPYGVVIQNNDTITLQQEGVLRTEFEKVSCKTFHQDKLPDKILYDPSLGEDVLLFLRENSELEMCRIRFPSVGRLSWRVF